MQPLLHLPSHPSQSQIHHGKEIQLFGTAAQSSVLRSHHNCNYDLGFCSMPAIPAGHVHLKHTNANQ